MEFPNRKITAEDISKRKKGRTKMLTMQEIYGTKAGKKCTDCKHHYRNEYGYNKCTLIGVTYSAKTDIAVRYACNKWEQKEGAASIQDNVL